MRQGNERAHLRALLDAVVGEQVMVPRPWLESLLRSSGESDGRDLSVAEVALRFRVGRSTVRTWAKQGRFPGAYQLAGHEWRFPAAALAGFELQSKGRPSEDPGLSAWRSELRRAG